jgi:hypothetical protein
VKFGLFVTVVVVCAVLSGCTTAAHSALRIPAARPTASAAPVAPVAVPTAIPNDPATRSDVTMSACVPTKDGQWRASGTIRNHAATDHNFHITVFFTNRASTVIGFAQASIRVGSGAKKLWQATGSAQDLAPTICVLRGVG